MVAAAALVPLGAEILGMQLAGSFWNSLRLTWPWLSQAGGGRPRHRTRARRLAAAHASRRSGGGSAGWIRAAAVLPLAAGAVAGGGVGGACAPVAVSPLGARRVPARRSAALGVGCSRFV